MPSQNHGSNSRQKDRTVPFFHTRGYLPHYETPEEPQHVTFRLYDSLPTVVLSQLAERLQHPDSRPLDVEHVRRIQELLDRGRGKCFLSNAAIAQMAEQAIQYFDGQRYRLHAWVIMPNHVHVLLSAGRGESMSGIMHSWKSFTAKRANAILGRQGTFWQREYFDRKIRDLRHFSNAVEYIHNNPVKAGLCVDPIDWQFSSARVVESAG